MSFHHQSLWKYDFVFGSTPLIFSAASGYSLKVHRILMTADTSTDQTTTNTSYLIDKIDAPDGSGTEEGPARMTGDSDAGNARLIKSFDAAAPTNPLVIRNMPLTGGQMHDWIFPEPILIPNGKNIRFSRDVGTASFYTVIFYTVF